jgi:hypothetical protein
VSEISIHLDWLRYTIKWDERKSIDENLSHAVPIAPVFEKTGEKATIGQGYDSGLRMGAGMVFWHSTNHNQGVSVQFSGTDLQTVRDSGMSELDLLMAIEDKNPQVTTLHSCINIHDAGARPTDVLEAKKKGTLTTRARHIGQYSSETKGKTEWLAGDTIYIGSPKSAVQIRIYNKAAEQRKAGDWIRIEIVFRGRYAMAAYEAMLKYGIPSVTRRLIQKQMNFTASWWVYAMRGGLAPPMHVKRKEPATLKWLKESVLPALEREIGEERRRNEDSLYEMYARLIDRLRPGQ